MSRPLITTLVLISAGFSSAALAETPGDIPVESISTEIPAEDAVAEKSRKPTSGKAQRSTSQGQGHAKPAKPATATHQAKPGVQAAARPQQVGPKSTAKPAAPTSDTDRQATNRNSQGSNARPETSRTQVNQARASTKKRPAPNQKPKAQQQPAQNRNVQVKRHTYAPPRWTPSYHRYHMAGVPRHHPRYWTAGVFYYNPPPSRHKVVVVHDGGQVASGPEPTRAIDRNNTFGVGLNAGSYNSGYAGGGGYGDMGVGLTATYRPVEAVGFEISWTHYDQSWDEDSERIHEPVQASVHLYAFPWTRVSPYLTLGLTQTGQDVDDTWSKGFSEETAETEMTLFGPHAGLGIEFALGSSAAIDFEGRYISYLDVKEGDPSASSALQGTMGLKFYF